jgi:hypothetical protein
MRFGLFVLIIAGLLPSVADASQNSFRLDPEQLEFRYQELLEPFDQVECKHEKAAVGLFEWDVYCKLGEQIHVFAVHLVLSRYGRTRYGESAYELLYWVTDRSQSQVRVFDSSTLWIHLDQAQTRASVIETSVGIENDLAALRLAITVF